VIGKAYFQHQQININEDDTIEVEIDLDHTSGVKKIKVGTSTSNELASKESMGFFHDIPEHKWMTLKNRFQLTQPNTPEIISKRNELTSDLARHFWADYFDPEFTCVDEIRFGKLGDGGKWICDPHRIVEDTIDGKDTCLVYSVGSNGHFQFEEEVKTLISKDCEIHTFDPNDYRYKPNLKEGVYFEKEAEKVGAQFHKWGIGLENGPIFKTFKEVITTLNHTNKIIDIMKIDCEGCEAKQYSKWLSDWKETGVLVRQVLMEIHLAPLAIEDLFASFQKEGYVIFHKEANYLSKGTAIEVALVLLSPDFQKLNY